MLTGMAIIFRVDPHQQRDSQSIGDKHVFGIVAVIITVRIIPKKTLTAGYVEEIPGTPALPAPQIPLTLTILVTITLTFRAWIGIRAKTTTIFIRGDIMIAKDGNVWVVAVVTIGG